ncbi:MAG TPA: hypothetical protein VIK53_15240 [Verrucomicrobiae bacterium]
MRILIWLSSCALAWSVSGAELHFNFGDYPEGSSPTNFHAALAGGGAAPDWKIVSAEVPSAFAPFNTNAPVVNHARVLAQTSGDMTDEHYPMFIYDGDTFNNFTFSTRFEIVGGIAEQMAGLVFRFQNSSNFYVVRVSSLGHNLRFYKVVNGLRPSLIGTMVDVPAGTWHKLTVKCEGTQINIFLDDRMVLFNSLTTINDNTFTDGKLGFWTKSDALSYFADAEVDYQPRVPAAQQMVNSVMEQEPRIVGLRIYTLQATNTTRIIASKETSEIGQAGTDTEWQAIQDGTQFFGRDHGTVLVTMPLRDRNGDDIAAMRVQLKSFFGETQDNAVTRAMMIRRKLEALCTSAADLRK